MSDTKQILLGILLVSLSTPTFLVFQDTSLIILGYLFAIGGAVIALRGIFHKPHDS